METIEKKRKGFVVQFHGGVQLLINLPVPECFNSVSSFFKKKKEKGEMEKRVRKLSDIRAAVKNTFDEKVTSYCRKGKGVSQKRPNEALSALDNGPKSIRMVFCFDEDLPFYTVRGLQARSLRLLEHRDFKDLPNGKHFSGDDFSESTEEDRSPGDEDAQMDLLLRACRDSATLSGSVEQPLEPRKKRQKHEA